MHPQEGLPIFLSVVFILLGLLSVTVGYRLWKMLIIITGIIIGATLSSYVAVHVWSVPPIMAITITVLGSGTITALIIFFRMVRMFVAGSVAGAFLGQLIASLFPVGAIVPIAICGIAGIILAYFFPKAVIICFTSCSGAVILTKLIAARCVPYIQLPQITHIDAQTLISLCADIRLWDELYGALSTCSVQFFAGWIVISVIGIVFQFKTTKFYTPATLSR